MLCEFSRLSATDRRHVLDPDRLEARVGPGQREEGRDLRHAREQREEGIAATEDHRGAEDRQVEVRGLQGGLAGSLRAQVAGRRIRRRLERRDMQHAAHAGRLGGVPRSFVAVRRGRGQILRHTVRLRRP
jgi:hypothetical protein